MFASWYLVKFNYVSPGSPETQTKIQGYQHSADAESLFEKLELSYLFDAKLRLRDDKLIKVTGVWLYQAFKFYLDEAVEAVKSGNADLHREARGLEINMEGQPNCTTTVT